MRRDRVQRFLPHLQREIEERLARGEYESFRTFSKELLGRGLHITKSALARLAERIKRGEVAPRTADTAVEDQARREAILGRRGARPVKRLQAKEQQQKKEGQA